MWQVRFRSLCISCHRLPPTLLPTRKSTPNGILSLIIVCLLLITFATWNNIFRLSTSKQNKVYLPEHPFPHAEVWHWFFNWSKVVFHRLNIFLASEEQQTEALQQHPRSVLEWSVIVIRAWRCFVLQMVCMKRWRRRVWSLLVTLHSASEMLCISSNCGVAPATILSS